MTRALAVLLLALSALAGVALAQEESAPDRTPTTILLDFGFAGILPAGQWAPVRIAISPMDEAIEATARIRISTPDGGSITSLVPVTSTPGRETLVPATLWIPPVMAQVAVELVSQDDGVIASTAYGSLAGPQSIQLPAPSPMPIILGVGSPSLRLAFGVDNYEREFHGRESEALRERASVARVASAVPPSVGAPPWLPAQAQAYSGVAAVVIDGQIARSIAPSSLEALREWLISGGRLVIVNANDNALRYLLGEHTPEELQISPPTQQTLPTAMGGPIAVLARPIEARPWPPGWSPVSTASALAAHGPVGLGWVMIMAFDPDVLAEQNQIEVVELAWHATLGEMVLGDLERGQSRLGRQAWDELSMRDFAAAMALAWVTRAPTVGIGAFAAIFVMMIALAFLIGPVDRLLLKRIGGLHRWWLAALGWIGLATLGALVLPAKVRSGPTTSSTIRVVDALETADGSGGAWQASISGMFFNRSARLNMSDIEADAWLSPMVHPWNPASVGTLVMLPRGSTMKPAPITGRLWTTKAFAQSGPVTPSPVRARLELDDDTYLLTLRGAGVESIDTLTIQTDGRWLHVLPGGSAERRDGEVRVVATVDDLVDVPPDAFDTSELWQRRYDFSRASVAPPPGAMGLLNDANRRSAALAALGRERDWAVVYATWTDGRPFIGSNIADEFSTQWVHRIAIPVTAPVSSRRGTP